jgi:hypothetical protein
MLFRVSGAICGLLLGSLTQMLPNVLYRLTSRSLQVSSWLLVILWLFQLVRVLIHFQMQIEYEFPRKTTNEFTPAKNEGLPEATHDDDSESSSLDDNSPSIDLIQKAVDSHSSSTGSLRLAERDQTYNGNKAPLSDTDVTVVSKRQESGARKKRKTIRQPTSKGRFFSKMNTFLSLFTATPLITERYFGWSGADASSFLGWLMILVLPINFICEVISRRYEERTVLKVRGCNATV